MASVSHVPRGCLTLCAGGCVAATKHHAGHVAMLLTAAEVIASHRATLKGSVKLLFQPAEEFGGGAKYMVRDGVLEGVDQV
jgi:metal-dependent amidase/aminoacylase/carboxypeptidase family protein